jgi:hypothetical protein
VLTASLVPDWYVRFAIDLALLVLVVEGLVFVVYRLKTGRGLPLLTVALISVSGIGLLMALRAALTGAAGHWVLLGLMVGGLAHAIDTLRRVRGGP